MDKQLLIETRHFDPKPVTLVEGMNKGGNVFVEGILATVEVKNGNGRYYKRELWEREIDNFMKKIQMKSTETVGELDHADSQVINLRNASHAIREVWWRGDEIWGRIELFSDPGELGTTSGRIAGALVRNGLLIGVSSRGMGSLKEVNGYQQVQEDFMLAAVDIVADPSAPNAFVNGIMEGKEWVWDNGVLKQVTVENYKNVITKTSSRNLEKTKIKIFEDFMSKLSKL